MTRKEKKKRNMMLIVILVIVLEMLFYLLAYLEGGIHSLSSQLMYIPIVIAGAFLGLKAGMISSLFAALLIGPLMPYGTTLLFESEVFFWLFRLFTFVSAGVLSGYLFDHYRLQKRMAKYYTRNNQRSNVVKES